MATITGIIKEPNGDLTPRTLIRFAMMETVSVGTAVHPKDYQTAVTDASGAFSISLVAGDYEVTIKNNDPFTITVGDAASYDIKDIISDGAAYPSTIADSRCAGISPGRPPIAGTRSPPPPDTG